MLGSWKMCLRHTPQHSGRLMNFEFTDGKVTQESYDTVHEYAVARECPELVEDLILIRYDDTRSSPTWY